MFTGVGGFELGLQSSESKMGKRSKEYNNTKDKHFKWKCMGFSEIDQFSKKLLKNKFPEIKNYGDATKINPSKLPDFDVLCGGFPCQAFSIAGKRKGFNDTRGTLFFEIARILEVKRPKIVFLENVKGLLNHEKGKTFRKIIQTISELGYNIQWMVLNSKFFGVPQNRERVFIIGSLRGGPRPEVLPINEDVRNPFEENSQICQCITKRYYKGANGTHIKVEGYLNKDGWDKRNESIRRIYNPEGCAPTIPTGQGGGVMTKIQIPNCIGMIQQIATKRTFETPKKINQFLKDNKGDYTIKDISKYLDLPKTQVEHYFRIDESRAIPDIGTWFELKKLLGFDDTWNREVATIYKKEVEFEQTRRVYDDSMVPTINSTQPSVHAVLTPDRPEKRQNGRRFKEDGEPSFTLTGQDIHGVSDGMKIRRLTPIECERLQGFPEGWTSGFSDTQRYKMMGNAVTVNVIKAIAEKLI